jgi:hypothetical protein
MIRRLVFGTAGWAYYLLVIFLGFWLFALAAFPYWVVTGRSLADAAEPWLRWVLAPADWCLDHTEAGQTS